MFALGFNKVAKSEKEKHDDSASNVDAAIGLIPLGTTLHTALGKRPKGHSRLKEWAGRSAGALVGAAPGAALMMHGMRRGHLGQTHAGRISSLVGGLVGEKVVSKHVRSGTKEKY